RDWSSDVCSSDLSRLAVAPCSGNAGVTMPSTTPEIVACTPEECMKYQVSSPSGTSTYQRVIPLRTKSENSAAQAATPSSPNSCSPWLYATARSTIESRSSTTARVSTKARNAVGTHLATSDSTATAKAISVAVGMAQPSGAPSLAETLMIR